MTYIYTMLLTWVLPLSPLGDPEYTIREQTQRRVATWGAWAAPALRQELLRPHTEESYARAEALLDRLPSARGVLVGLLVSGGHAGVNDEALAALAPAVMLRLHARDLIPTWMDDDWLATGGYCYHPPENATAGAVRTALDTALTTRVIRWRFASWYRPN